MDIQPDQNQAPTTLTPWGRTLLQQVHDVLTKLALRTPSRALLPILLMSLVLPTGLFLAFVVPVGQVPDEPAHVARAESLLHGEIFGRHRIGVDFAGRPIRLPGVVINPSPVVVTQLFSGYPQGQKITAASMARLDHVSWAPRLSFVYAPNTAVYFPLFYVPAAVGLALARLDGRSPLAAVFAARVANLGFYIGTATLALLLTQRGRVLMFATLSLPLMVWLAASCSQDGMLVACCCLSAALLSRSSRPNGASYWSAAGLLACIIASKPGYLPLAAVMLAPGMTFAKPPRLSAVLGGVVAGLPGTLWTLLMLRYVAGPFIWGPPYHPGPLWPGNASLLFAGSDPDAQAHVLLHNPSLIIALPLRALYSQGLWNLHEAVGVLGLLNVVMAHAMYQLWFVALSLAAVSDLLALRPAADGHFSFAIISLIAVAMTIVGIWDLEYLSWTKVGASMIDGGQGRYLLPLLPMLAIALPRLRLANAAWLRGALAVPAVAMVGVGMAYLPILVLDTYYLS